VTAAPEWVDDATLVVDGVTFVAATTGRFTSTPDRFCLVKRPDLVRNHLALLAELRPRRVVELGVFQGGSAALVALVARPELLVAVELAETRVAALDTLVEGSGLTGSVHVHHGVDQGDRAALEAVLDAHGLRSGRPLDLVVDDASHLVGPSRASFDLLFPLLRPGGVFVLEDWSWAHVGYGLHLPDEQPLTEVVFELTMALPSRPGLIADLRIDRDWVVVTRGEADVDPATFRLADCYSERGRALLASRSAEGEVSPPGGR